MNRKKAAFLIIILLLIFIAISLFRSYEERHSGVLTLYGNVDIRQADLGFRVSGRLIVMRFEEGDMVKKGQILAEIDPQPYKDAVWRAAAAKKAAEITLENTVTNVTRREPLVKSGAVSTEDFEDMTSKKEELAASLEERKASLSLALTDLEDTKIHAPNDGIILTRIREPGTIMKVADPVYALSLFDPVWIRTYVSEPQLGKIYPGMKAMIYTDSGTEYQGHIGFISPVAEFTPKTVETTELRTDLVYRLRIIVENPNLTLRQGMPVTVKLQI